MEWTTDMALRFMRTYSKHPVLYDPKHEHYKRKHHVDSAWLSINDELASWGFSVDDLKKKKESLAGYYRIHLNKMKKMRAKGKQYCTSWFAFKTMHNFLSRIYDVDVECNVAADDIEEDGCGDSQYFLEDEYLDVDKKPVVSTRESESEDDCYSNASNSTKYRPLARHRVPSRDQPNNLKPVEAELESSGKKRMSDNELFAELLVRKLSRLGEDVRLDLMNDIDNLVYKTTVEAKRKGKTNSHDPLN